MIFILVLLDIFLVESEKAGDLGGDEMKFCGLGLETEELAKLENFEG